MGQPARLRDQLCGDRALLGRPPPLLRRSRRLRRPAAGLNLLYLAAVVLIPFSSEVLGEYGGETPAVVLYSVNLAVVVLVGLWMGVDARRRGLTSMDDETHRETRIRSTYIAGVFLLSVPLAFVVPRAAAYLWFLLFLDPSARLARRATSGAER